MSAPDRRIPDTIQINMVLDEVKTILSALSEETVHPSMQRFVRPLQVKLEMAERVIEDRMEGSR